MENSHALIPLIGITPDSIYSFANAYTYTNHMTVVFHLPPSLFDFLLFRFIYLFTIYNPDRLYSNKNYERSEIKNNLVMLHACRSYSSVIDKIGQG